jgi:hypothetical protein
MHLLQIGFAVAAAGGNFSFTVRYVLVERLTPNLHVQSLIGRCTGDSRCNPLLRGAIQERGSLQLSNLNSCARAGSMTAADVLIETLIDWGVDIVFGLPGDGINGSLRTLIRFVSFR